MGQYCFGSIIIHCLKFHHFDDFMEQLTLIPHLNHNDSHSLEAVSHSSLNQVIDQVIFPFISYFPMMCHCVCFITHFLSDLSRTDTSVYVFYAEGHMTHSPSGVTYVFSRST